MVRSKACIVAAGFLAACATPGRAAPRGPVHDDAPQAAAAPPAPPPEPGYRARFEVRAITVAGTAHPVDSWTEIFVAGTDERHKHACETVLREELDWRTRSGVDARVQRSCDLAPLPAAARGQGFVLVDAKTVDDAVVTDYSRFATKASCETLRARVMSARQRPQPDAAGDWLREELRAAEAERDPLCSPPLEVAACERAKAMVEIVTKRLAEQKPEPPPPPPTCEPA